MYIYIYTLITLPASSYMFDLHNIEYIYMLLFYTMPNYSNISFLKSP